MVGGALNKRRRPEFACWILGLPVLRLFQPRSASLYSSNTAGQSVGTNRFMAFSALCSRLCSAQCARCSFWKYACPARRRSKTSNDSVMCWHHIAARQREKGFQLSDWGPSPSNDDFANDTFIPVTLQHHIDVGRHNRQDSGRNVSASMQEIRHILQKTKFRHD